MQHFAVRALVAVVALCVASQHAAAQQAPPRPTTPEQARALMRARPDFVQQMRQQLLSGALTREQIRARLRAAGYPEDMLDAYLPGGTGIADAPTGDFFNAIQELGIVDSTDVPFLRALQSDTLTQSARDSLLRTRDTTAARDSLTQFRRRSVRTDVADSVARLDSGYNIFGLDVFRSTTTRFDPSLTGPVDANYRLGPGDRLVLILTGDVEAAHQLSVTREGFVVIPQVGRLDVANLTIGQLEDLLYNRLGRVYSGVRRSPSATTSFSISVAGLRTNQVFVMGEVERPGSHNVSSAGTAMTAVYAAGGPSANGSMRTVQVKRAGKIVGELDLYDYLIHGDASHDVRLQTGDIVFVPSRGARVRVIGEVIRPATYELKPTETLADLIRAAGGFTPIASRRKVHIERILPPTQRASGGERVTVDFEGPELLNGSPPEYPLLPGDVVHVFAVTDRVRNTVTVKGNVWAPGPQGLTPGMRISEAVARAGGPKPDVYLGQVLVSRLRPDSTREQLRAAFRDSTGSVLGDFPLREDDVIEVFSLTSFRPERTVTIGGAVRKAGRYPFRQGMTMRDLILLAGGLKESAYLKEAEVARLPEDRTGLATAQPVRVQLDSTYLFERKPGERYLGAPGLQSNASGAPEFELKPYDNVLIMHQPNWELQRLVTITGEVKFAGTYALRTRNERVADLIERAGGFTSEAYPEGTVFVRLKNDVGRVAIDVPRALKKPNDSDNLLLMDGDQIMVPVRSNVVTVRGAVNADPTVVAYVSGKDIDYYIDQAGGSARNADNRRAFITQPNGKRERKSMGNRSPKPMPGALVVVPEIDPSNRVSWITIAAAVAPIVASLATLVIALP